LTGRDISGNKKETFGRESLFPKKEEHMHAIFAMISAGLLTFAFVRICPNPRPPSPPVPPPPPCPKHNLKDILAFFFAVIGVIIYFQICKIGFGTFTEPVHFINAHITGLAIGAGIRSIWCPY
jgi:hypothetical protein